MSDMLLYKKLCILTYDRLSNSLSKEGDIDPLILIALYVLDFLCIHPFLDGNGRMARLITVLLLYHYGYEVSRYISLERVIEQTKESYYETLHKSSQGWHKGKHDALPWVEYFLATLLAAYKEFESRFERVSSGRGSKTDIVLNAIYGFIGDFGISDLEKACPTVSRDMLRHILFKLRDQGRVQPIGKGRSARWRKIV
ncbi:MAG: Fic family protein [Nitrospirota bacterium]